jgi:hypothetical protein
MVLVLCLSNVNKRNRVPYQAHAVIGAILACQFALVEMLLNACKLPERQHMWKRIAFLMGHCASGMVARL